MTDFLSWACNVLDIQRLQFFFTKKTLHFRDQTFAKKIIVLRQWDAFQERLGEYENSSSFNCSICFIETWRMHLQFSKARFADQLPSYCNSCYISALPEFLPTKNFNQYLTLTLKKPSDTNSQRLPFLTSGTHDIGSIFSIWQKLRGKDIWQSHQRFRPPKLPVGPLGPPEIWDASTQTPNNQGLASWKPSKIRILDVSEIIAGWFRKSGCLGTRLSEASGLAANSSPKKHPTSSDKKLFISIPNCWKLLMKRCFFPCRQKGAKKKTSQNGFLKLFFTGSWFDLLLAWENARMDGYCLFSYHSFFLHWLLQVAS